MKSTISIGILGFGNVGAGVVQLLNENRDLIERRTSKSICVKTIVVRDPKKYRHLDCGNAVLTTDAIAMIHDPAIDVIVEAIGGENPAFEYICEALKLGKYVVTANKEVISKHKKRFFDLAKAHDSDIYYEAAVGGGIPLIRTLKVGVAANRIESLHGILNGTTNYILTKLNDEGKEFGDVVADAQAKGFAEADPSMDVSGLDTAYKLSILASVAFKADIPVSEIPYEGIESIALRDMQLAAELGYTIKLLASGKQLSNGKLSFKVCPTMIPRHHPLAGVRNEFNAVFIVGNAVGESMLSGRGAGSSPTGSAIVSDIIDIAFDSHRTSLRNLEYAFDKVSLAHESELKSQFFVRLLASDAPGTLATIATILAHHQVSISKIMQKPCTNHVAEIVFITHSVAEDSMSSALIGLETDSVVQEIVTKLRVGLDEGDPV